MCDESTNISERTWTRAVVNINKVGYSDGVTDGQNASFQSCFDMGYMQGLEFGLTVGYKAAIAHQVSSQSDREELNDPCKVNCQICLDGTTMLQSVVNLYNTQKEKNDTYQKE